MDSMKNNDKFESDQENIIDLSCLPIALHATSASPIAIPTELTSSSNNNNNNNNSSPSFDNKITRARKYNWRSKTWKSELTRKYEKLRNSINKDSDYNYTRKHSLTVPGESFFFQHHPHHHHHQQQNRQQRHHHHNCHHQRRQQDTLLRRYSNEDEKYIETQRMGHHQKDHKPVESKQNEVKVSNTPSPITTPSPSGSLAGDEPSCSSCSSSGLDLDFARKCTVSADSLLLHPDISTMSGSEGEMSRDDDDDDGDDERRTNVCFLKPDTLNVRKICSSISSDQIHKHSMFMEAEQEEELKKKKSEQRKSSKDDSNNTVGGGSKRKESVTNIVLSSTGRIARLLRRTHSAGCSKDVPSHALFLRERSNRKHRRNLPEESASSSDQLNQKKLENRKHQTALGDIKQRLKFLRRGHDSSTSFDSPSSSSVRPNAEEAERWAQSFQNLMANKYGSTLFKAFLSREFCQENMDFWLACEEYKLLRTNKMPSKAKKIFDTYIAIQSPKEVNLESNLRKIIEENIRSPEKSCFDIAQRKIQGLLESDAYLRFLQSDLYRELVTANQKPQQKQLQHHFSIPKQSTSCSSTDEYNIPDSTGKQSPESSL